MRIPVSLVAVAVTLGCGASSSAPTSEIIGAAGGTITRPDGVSLTVPSGALSVDTEIRISVVTSPPPLGSYTAHGHVYAFEPHGLTFAAPVRISLPAESGGAGLIALRAEPGTSWEVHAASVQGDHAELMTSSFSFYCLARAAPDPPDGGAPDAATMGRIELAGGQNTPWGLTIDETHVYWTTYYGGTVMKVAKTGGAPVTLASGQQSPGTIAVDGTFAYWNAGTQLLKAPLAGGGPVTPFGTGGEVHYRDGYLYTVDLTNVVRIPVGGGAVETVAATSSAANQLELDATHVYWIDGQYQIMRAPLAGGTPTPLGTVTGASELAITSSRIFVTRFWEHDVWTLPLAGGAPTVFAMNELNPTSIVADETSVYWYINGGWIRFAPVSGGTPATISDANQPAHIALDDTSAYFADWLRPGKIWRLSPR